MLLSSGTKAALAHRPHVNLSANPFACRLGGRASFEGIAVDATRGILEFANHCYHAYLELDDNRFAGLD